MRIKAAPGLILEELYEVIESFGGGMGAVHRVRHRSWNIEVAIKHPLESAMLNPEQLEMFYSECVTWSKIGLHPYVATCFYAREINGLPCVVAEFVQKGSLHESIHRRELYRGDEDECLARMLTIAASTAFGLARAHEANLIHCDVKPANILLTYFGAAKITDFGLAIARIGSDGLTRQSWMTEAYAAPEQLIQESLTPAVDAWGWGASMLEMFLGNRSWQRGTACGAILGKFLEDGGKEYRIPRMPASFATLLGECFRFDPDKRLSDLAVIAAGVCQCYEEIFEESCPASKPDLELISADSLNNRAVSHYDLGDILEVHRLLDEALTVDPLHPESNFNSALLGYSSIQIGSKTFLDRLEQGTQFDLGEYRPWLYQACLLNLDGRSREANDSLEKARQLAGIHEIPEIQRLWELSSQRKTNPVLAPPISGEDFAHDSARFERLMTKAEAAIHEHQLDDAKRYLLMSGDIPGFARHPRRRRALTRTNQ